MLAVFVTAIRISTTHLMIHPSIQSFNHTLTLSQKLSEAAVEFTKLESDLASIEQKHNSLLLLSVDDLCNSDEDTKGRTADGDGNTSSDGGDGSIHISWRPSVEFMVELNREVAEEVQQLEEDILRNNHSASHSYNQETLVIEGHLTRLRQDRHKCDVKQLHHLQTQHINEGEIQAIQQDTLLRQQEIKRTRELLKELQSKNDAIEYELSEYASRKKRERAQALINQGKKTIAPRSLSQELILLHSCTAAATHKSTPPMIAVEDRDGDGVDEGNDETQLQRQQHPHQKQRKDKVRHQSQSQLQSQSYSLAPGQQLPPPLKKSKSHPQQSQSSAYAAPTAAAAAVNSGGSTEEGKI